MIDDPRLAEWLRVTEQILALCEEPLGVRLEAVEPTLRLRSSLQASLEADPPTPPSRALAEKLRAAERHLMEQLGDLRGSLSQEIDTVRRRRTATRGYRPTRPHRPSFVSRSI